MVPQYFYFCRADLKRGVNKPEGTQVRFLLWRSMMLRWALGFFVIALIAAVLGFGGIALAAAGIAKIIFYIFLVLFVVSLIGHLASRT
jgi:uncharacterized membrane protein YtjA (UPF0391 family)